MSEWSSTTNEWSLMTRMLDAAIPEGWSNAIRRERLAQVLGMSDRAVRSAIENARREGLVILNAQDGRGYYKSHDPRELALQYKQDTSRALAILRRRKPLRDLLKKMGVEV